jgi:serine/threonine protein kinase
MALSAPAAISRYQVLNRLDQGGAATVYLARDPAIDRLVAIKLLHGGRDDAGRRERIVREARSAGRLRHANIVTIFEVGAQDDQTFITMEFVKGVTLHDLIAPPGALPIARKLQLMDQLCAGLQYAHRAGVIHGAIKPKSLMIGEDGLLKILDFGIERPGGSAPAEPAATTTGVVNYLSPEQIGGQVVDARADMFSAGAVFYELLSNKRAFAGDVEAEVLQMIVSGQPEPLDAIQPDLDGRLVALVSRCLEKAPARRYPDMAAVREELGVVRQRFGATEDGAVPAQSETLARDRERLNDRTKRAEEEVTRARAVIRLARERFDAGDHDAAISILEAFQPARLVANALAGFRADLRKIGEVATVSFERIPTAARAAVTSPGTVTPATLPVAPVDAGAPRVKRSAVLAVAIGAALGLIVWLLLNLR